MGANPLQVREQVLLLPLEVGAGGAVHFGASKSLMLDQGPMSGTALGGLGCHAPPASSCLLSVSAVLVASSQATSSLSCWLKKSVFVADFILAAGCAAVSTGGSRHPTVANFADFFKKRKNISSEAIDALWEGGRRYRGKLLLKGECLTQWEVALPDCWESLDVF